MSRRMESAREGVAAFWLGLRVALAGILGLCAVMFAFQNTEPVELDFAVWTFSISEALVIFVAFLAGAGGALVLAGWWRWRRRKRAVGRSRSEAVELWRPSNDGDSGQRDALGETGRRPATTSSATDATNNPASSTTPNRSSPNIP